MRYPCEAASDIVPKDQSGDGDSRSTHPAPEREGSQGGDYVLYWMQEAQRAEYNYALEYAAQRANELEQRLPVVFGLMDGYPGANLRHYAFMLEGLQDVYETLKERKIKFVVRCDSPNKLALALGKDASLIVCDMSYLRLQKGWRERVAEEAGCAVVHRSRPR